MNSVIYVRFKFRCIPELFRCDGEKDCKFNEDEETCGESLGYKFQVLAPFSFTHIYWEQTSLFVSEYTLPLYTKEENFALAKGGEEAYENIPLELVINLSSHSVRIVKIPISDFSEEILPYNTVCSFFQCARYCAQSTRFICRSFHYLIGKRECFLSSLNRERVTSRGNYSSAYDYYELKSQISMWLVYNYVLFILSLFSAPIYVYSILYKFQLQRIIKMHKCFSYFEK